MANTHLGAPSKSGRPPAANVRVPSGRPDDGGITIINIDTRPPSARTITDHVAVLTPNAWLMPGHYAGLLNTQTLGDYVLEHSYVREEHVLNEDLPPWVPIPTLAEMQNALEKATEDITSLAGYDLTEIMGTGTGASINNRNWELGEQTGIIHRLSQSRTIAHEMEPAPTGANGCHCCTP